jgi:SAM-dependent methyltransferase
VKTGTDAFGLALLDWARGGTIPETVERDDGFTTTGAGPDVYLSEFKGWPAAERQSIRHVRGRVIDVGCGAGRVALNLQQRGIDVVGLDASRLAVKAARIRGVKDVWCMSIDTLSRRIGSFDTIVLFGNNFGIFGTPDRARQLLTEWAKRPNPRTRIVVGTLTRTAVTLPRSIERITTGTASAAICQDRRVSDITTATQLARGFLGSSSREVRCDCSFEERVGIKPAYWASVRANRTSPFRRRIDVGSKSCTSVG